MTSFELEIDEKSLIGSQFLEQVTNEIKRAAAAEKISRKITQQAIADKIGTSRHVINRQMMGYENLSARRIAEILWALGWEPHFVARKIPASVNDCLVNSAGRRQESGRAETTQGTVDLIAPLQQPLSGTAGT